MRQVMRLLDVLRAEAGRQRADDQHRRRQLGEGVDAHARRDDGGEHHQPDADHQDRDRVAAATSAVTASATLRRRADRASPSSSSARPSVTTGVPAGSVGIEEQRAAALAEHRDDRRAVRDAARRRRRRVALSPRTVARRERDRGRRLRLRRRRSSARAVVPTGSARSAFGTSISKWTVRVACRRRARGG